MPSMETLLSSPIEWSVRATGTNATVTATKAAPTSGVGFRHYIFGLTISASDAPAATVEVQVRKNSATTPVVLDGFQLPTAQFAPIIVNYLSHPFEGDDNGDVDVTIPALGAGVIAVAILKGTTRCRG